MVCNTFGSLEKTGIGELIKSAFKAKGLSYEMAAERLNEAEVRDEHGGGLNKARIASYALERNRAPKWFLDGVIVALALPRDYFDPKSVAKKLNSPADTSLKGDTYIESGARMRRVPLIHLWESARIHDLMTGKGAWEGSYEPIPDFISSLDVMAARIDTDAFGPLLERGDALIVHQSQPLRFDFDYIVTVKDGMTADIARCHRGGRGTCLRLLSGRRDVMADELHIEALIVGRLPQYNHLRPHGSWHPDGYVLPGDFPV